ncbi:type II secretion system F family protein [Candidatus Kaiserbacteria bacterium]|nr:type II secretion system F family protein [Candidatus Kaiserbacteria bacterium]
MGIFNTVSPQERVDFTKNLAIMLKSGITINEALAELAVQSDSKRFSEVIKRVMIDVENGTSLSKSFGKEEKIFGSIFVSLIRAGEESGTLQGNLQFLSDWLNRSTDLRREVAAATMYPKLVFGAAILLGGSLALFILPKLVPLFGSLNVELPIITKVLLAISLWVQEYWLLTIFGVVGVIAGIIYINSFYVFRRLFHIMYLHIPFMGEMLKDYQRALVAQLFATLLKSGLSLNESIHIVSEAATNISYQESLRVIHGKLVKGTTLSDSMRHFGKLFPNMMISIVSVGEKSGSLVKSFEYLSEFFSKEVNMQAKKIPTIIEPLLLVFIAVIVGFVALAIIMPIYELTSSF